MPDFKARIEKSISTYSRQYDDIVYELLAVLGPSRFKIEYLKQITSTSKELENLPFASLDLSELFRRHVACSTNTEARYEELVEEPDKLEQVNRLLRTSNYGLTLLVLLLDGTLQGPSWLMAELKRVTSGALLKMESMPEVHATPGQLAGSLVIAEGNLDLPSTEKSR